MHRLPKYIDQSGPGPRKAFNTKYLNFFDLSVKTNNYIHSYSWIYYKMIYTSTIEWLLLLSKPEEKESQGQGDNKDDYIEDDDVGEIGRSGHDHALLSGSDDHVLEVWLTAKVGQKKVSKYY